MVQGCRAAGAVAAAAGGCVVAVTVQEESCAVAVGVDVSSWRRVCCWQAEEGVFALRKWLSQKIPSSSGAEPISTAADVVAALSAAGVSVNE